MWAVPPGGHTESRVQTGGAVVFVIVRSALALSRIELEHGLGSIQILDLSLLVHGQHQRVV